MIFVPLERNTLIEILYIHTRMTYKFPTHGLGKGKQTFGNDVYGGTRDFRYTVHISLDITVFARAW